MNDHLLDKPPKTEAIIGVTMELPQKDREILGDGTWFQWKLMFYYQSQVLYSTNYP